MLTMFPFSFCLLPPVEPPHSKGTARLEDAWSGSLSPPRVDHWAQVELQTPTRFCAPGLRGLVGALTGVVH